MKKTATIFGLLFFVFIASSFAVHKFYMSVTQVNYAPEKKMLQITTRIFRDDLNKILEKKYHSKTFIGFEKESQNDIDLLQKYLNEKFILKVANQTVKINFLSKEIDADVIVCYLSAKGISKIKELTIMNSILTDLTIEQQNIVHCTIFGTKKSVLFTDSKIIEVLNYN